MSSSTPNIKRVVGTVNDAPNTISRVNGYAADSVVYIPVSIIGAGESGVATACRLKQKLGFDQFRIFDRHSGIGGTWWINRYPGVACDIPAMFYSFSFSPNHKWSAIYPTGPEICKYLNDTCTKFQITDKIQNNTDVESCEWIEKDQLWELKLRYMFPGTGDLSNNDRRRRMEKHGVESVYVGRQTIRSKVVVSCVGGLVEPNEPPKNVPGWDQFQGEVFHSARWRYDIDFTDKNVVVLGTGCSAAQFVPELPKAPFNAKNVTQLMRSPPWVVPKLRSPWGDEWWAEWTPYLFTNVPGLGFLFRMLIFLGAEHDWRLFGMSTRSRIQRQYYEMKLLKHLKKTVPEKYHKMLTPDYGVGCKRRIFDATWFPGLNDERIELTTEHLRRVNPTSVIIQEDIDRSSKEPQPVPEEREVPADIIVLANGFETAKWFHPLNVIGRGGTNLTDEMERRGGAQAYLGSAMDGFPNFFAIFGPNTATGHSSVILASENMIEHSLHFIEKVLNGDATTVEVKREAEMAYTDEIQSACKRTVFNSGGCHNWYVHGDWNTTVYPYTQFDFMYRCLFPNWSHWDVEYTRKGIWKNRMITLAKAAALAFAITVPFRAKQYNESLAGLKNMISKVAVQALKAVAAQ